MQNIDLQPNDYRSLGSSAYEAEPEPVVDEEARRKEREQNAVPMGPRWLWDWTWWVSIIALGVGMYVARVMRGMG